MLNRCARIMVATLCAISLVTVSTLAQTTVTIRQGRMIEAEMIDDARSNAVEPEGTAKFKIVEDVEVHGIVAIKKGSEGVLTIKEAEKNGMIGKPGRVVFGEGYVKAGPYEVPVVMKGRSEFKGKSMKIVAIPLCLVLVGFLIKGKQGGLKPGEHFFIEVSSTMQIPVAG